MAYHIRVGDKLLVRGSMDAYVIERITKRPDGTIHQIYVRTEFQRCCTDSVPQTIWNAAAMLKRLQKGTLTIQEPKATSESKPRIRVTAIARQIA